MPTTLSFGAREEELRATWRAENDVKNLQNTDLQPLEG